MEPGNFESVISLVGPKPEVSSSQDVLRHYSEEFSRQTALWLKNEVAGRFSELEILNPEAKVDTIYGENHKGKSLDVAGLTDRKYLAVDFSIKTFNFKDRRTNNYRKNYTGRFYELLGEELDLRRSYKYAILVALIILPEDSLVDSNPSSFAHAVRQFSKIAKQKTEDSGSFGFEFVFVGFHGASGMSIFNATDPPPKYGSPTKNNLLTFGDMLAKVYELYEKRKFAMRSAPLPVYRPFQYVEQGSQVNSDI